MLASLRKRDLDFFATHLRSHGLELRTFEYLKFYGTCIMCKSSSMDLLGMLENRDLFSWFEDQVKPSMSFLKFLIVGLDVYDRDELPRVVLLLSPSPVTWIYAIDRTTTVYRGNRDPVVEHRVLFFSEKHRRDVSVCSNAPVRPVFTVRSR